MPKFKVTNTSQKSGSPRNIFLTEAGKMIKPGEHCVCNRLDSGTQAQVDAGILGLEEGDFVLPSIFDEKPSKPDEPALPVANAASMAADAREREAEAKVKAESEAKAKAEVKVEAEAEVKVETETTKTEETRSSKMSNKKNRGKQ